MGSRWGDGSHMAPQFVIMSNTVMVDINIRPRIWTKIAMNDLVNPLVQLRKQLKDLTKQGIQKNENEGKQKLITNTLYGVIASQYFETNNTVIANNITAQVRNNIWKASRCLQGIQCITDGFQYQPDNVLAFKKNYNNKPRLEILSDYEALKKHRSIIKISLGNIDWKPLYEKKDLSQFPNVDELAQIHINEFWKQYDDPIPFVVEHKMENTSNDLFTIKKAHYAFKTLENKIKYKFRGLAIPEEDLNFKKSIHYQNDEYLDEDVNFQDYPEEFQTEIERETDSHEDLQKAVFSKIAHSLLTRTNLFLSTLEVKVKSITTINDYLFNQMKIARGELINQLFPGDPQFKIQTFKLTNEDLPCKNWKEYKKWKANPLNYASKIRLGVLITPEELEQILNERISDHLK